MLPINAYFHLVCLVSMFLCCNICFEKEIQLLLDSLICLEMLSYDKLSDKKMIEHTSLFIFDLAIGHTLFVSA